MIAEFGPPSTTSKAQSAAYPFTRLRADRVWVLDQNVPMDLVGRLARRRVTGQLEAPVESALLARPALIGSVARDLVLSNFPATVAPDVLQAVGLDPARCSVPTTFSPQPEACLVSAHVTPGGELPCYKSGTGSARFCGYDGQVTGASVGIEAAHVRWFAFDGPDALDNGPALCALHHKLFDLGALGLSLGLQVMVSAKFSARTPVGRAACDLHGHQLAPRPGTAMPAAAHITWHTRQVFKGEPLAA